MFKKVILTSIISTIVFFSITFLTTNANAADHIIKTIYFVPKDRDIDRNHPKILADRLKEVQQIFADQMEKHGYGNKTFRIHEDGNGNPIVQQVIGKFNDSYYINDTLNKVYSELDAQFPDFQQNLYVVSTDVSSELIGGYCGKARYHAGLAIIPTKGDCVADNNRAIQLMTHEIGHAFNLRHDFRDKKFYMGRGYERKEFSECAASTLAINPFLNRNHIHENIAEAEIEMLSPQTYPLNNKNWKIRFEVSDPDGIYQINLEYAKPSQEATLIDCQPLQNKLKTTVSFNIPIEAAKEVKINIWLHVIDKNANYTTAEYMLTGVDTNQKFMYLTLERVFG